MKRCGYVRDERRGERQLRWTRVGAVFAVLMTVVGCQTVYYFGGTTYAPAPAGGSTISGSTTDGREMLSGVTVNLLEPKRFMFVKSAMELRRSVVSDKNGRFEIPFIGNNFTRSGYVLQFSKAGYQTREIDVSADVQDPALAVRSCQKAEVCVEVNILLTPTN